VEDVDWVLVGLGRSSLGILRSGENLGGGGGRTPNLPKSHPTRSDGWAPTDNQYFNRSTFNRISFIPTLFGIGL
jgi:hypothetical protein